MTAIILSLCIIAGWLLSRPLVRLVRPDYSTKRGMVAGRVRARHL